MQIKTSSKVDQSQTQAIAGKLRQAAQQARNDKFFPSGEKLEVTTDPNAPTIEEQAKAAKGTVMPMGDPTICAVAYAVAKELCDGDALCLVAAGLAYKLCLDS